jgi:predicted nucleic acid-binding protein
MPARLRVYLDTSVLSACVDPRDPTRQELTRQFWLRVSAYDACVSPLVLEEIGNTPDLARQQEMLALAEPLSVLSWEPEMEILAQRYVAGG